MTVPAGRFPTHKAWPDCFGFRGGPRGIGALDAIDIVGAPSALRTHKSVMGIDQFPPSEKCYSPGCV